MNIQQLADFFHLNKQTVRFYRDQRLLNPSQRENRYFDYGLDELAALFQILNLRQTDHSLQDIRAYMTDGTEALQTYLRKEESHLAQVEEKLAELTRVRDALLHRINYRRSVIQFQQDIAFNKDSPGLYYLTQDQFARFPDEVSILAAGPAYQSIVIPLEQFLDPGLSSYCPQYALGFTHRHHQIREQLQACQLSRYHVVESGQTSLRTILRLSQLNQLDASLFQPVKEYAARHRLRFTAPVTSIILLAMCEPENAYYVLFRFIVEKEP